MKYLSLFSGIGGFELGIKRAQPTWECVGFSEIDKYAIRVYKKHFDHKELGDVTRIITDELPGYNLLVGGFPCQSFSIAGKRAGFEDTRGTLFFEIARILRDTRPRYFLLENVSGLLSHDKGKTFQRILGVLTDLGYELQWSVLNSKNFGIPQNRERVFITGNIRGERRPEIFLIRKTDRIYNESREAKKEVCILAQTLTARQFASWNGNYIQQLNNPIHSNNRIYNIDGISPSLNTMQGGLRQPFIAIGSNIRRLTEIECERLQGFSDRYTEGISSSQRYKCLGNAVTVNVVMWIINQMSKIL